MRISDWSSDVCSSDLGPLRPSRRDPGGALRPAEARRLQLRARRRAARRRHRQPQRRRPRQVAVLPAAVDDCGSAARTGRSGAPGAGGSEVKLTPRLQPPTLWTYTRSEEHTSELQYIMRISIDVFCFKKKRNSNEQQWCKDHT